MTRDEVLNLIRSSLSRGTATPIFEDDREAAIQLFAGELEAAVIDPVPAHVRGAAFGDASLLELLASETPLVVAHQGDSWLGYIPSRGDFFLAFGAAPDQLHALGFHSTDALAEWRG